MFPVTRVDKTVDVGDEAPGNYNEIDVQVWKDYDPEESHGALLYNWLQEDSKRKSNCYDEDHFRVN